MHGPSYLDGLAQTAFVALWASLGALLLGIALTLLRLMGGRWAAALVGGYVQVLRNIPVLLPIYLIYFGLPTLGLFWPAVVCGGMALIMQNAAFISEIFRGSIKAIDRVQFDATRSLGLSPWTTFRRVTLPQLLVYSLPALRNQAVLLLKDTSLLSVITDRVGLSCVSGGRGSIPCHRCLKRTGVSNRRAQSTLAMTTL